MQAPTRSLLSRARAYMQNHRVGRTALTVAPLAVLGLAAQPAQAATRGGGGANFANPAASFFYGQSGGYDSNFLFQTSGGDLSQSATGPASNGVTGTAFVNGVTYDSTQSNDGPTDYTGQTGSLNLFFILGGGSGNFAVDSNLATIHYDFTLSATDGAGPTTFAFPQPAAGPVNDAVTINDFTLNFSITTSTGTSTAPAIINTDGVGTYSGDLTLPVSGTLQSYSASLSIDYTLGPDYGLGDGTTISVDLPTGSIDLDAVPEPRAWALLAVGGGALVLVARRARPLPPVVE